ncbi:MAG TPA: M17 family peptidase N-terminal domain-containing protein, partial [Nitrospinaceae bacterium]|nr:M17 family peptidase N-terminal domain-containing protein [Nitrospinaceae bacterium]
MEITLVQNEVTEIETDVLVVNLFEGVTSPGGATGAVDKMIGGLITDLIVDGEISGSESELTLIHTSNSVYPDLKASRVLIAGLGSSDRIDTNAIRRVSATVIRKLREVGVKKFATIVHGAGIGGVDVSSSAQSLVEGSLLGAYRFLKYRTTDTKRKPDVESMVIVESDSSKLTAIGAAIKK